MRTAPTVALAATLAALLAGAPSAAAQMTTCDTTLSGVVAGPIDVPPGDACQLAQGTTIQGATTIEGTLNAPQAATFQGDVTATNAGAILIDRSTIEGALKLTGGTGAVQLVGDTIEGQANIDSNNTDVLIGGDTFTSSLECSANNPAPHDGGASTIDGTASGQCAGFRGPGGGTPPPIKPIKLPGRPSLHRGELLLPLQCTLGFCGQLIRVTITDQGHKLTLGGRHANLGRGARTTWKFRLSRSWQSRLRHHRGHMVVTVAGVVVFSGSI